MKKVLSLLLVVSFVFILCSCSFGGGSGTYTIDNFTDLAEDGYMYSICTLDGDIDAWAFYVANGIENVRITSVDTDTWEVEVDRLSYEGKWYMNKLDSSRIEFGKNWGDNYYIELAASDKKTGYAIFSGKEDEDPFVIVYMTKELLQNIFQKAWDAGDVDQINSVDYWVNFINNNK